MSSGLSRPVTSLIGDALGRSAVLAAATLVVVCLIATPVGVAGALLRGTAFNQTGREQGVAGDHRQ